MIASEIEKQTQKHSHFLENNLMLLLEKHSQTNNIQMEKKIIFWLTSEKESQIMKNYCLIIMKLLNQDYKLTNKFKLLRYGSLIILRGLYVNLKTRF